MWFNSLYAGLFIYTDEFEREKLSETSRDQRWQLPVCLYQAGVIIFCKRRYHGWNFLRGLIFLSLSDKQINIL